MGSKRIVALLLSLVIVLSLWGCGGETPATAPQTQTPGTTAAPESTAPAVILDYAGMVELDMDSATAKQEVTVRNFVDGDTVHFHVPQDVMETGVLKARFLAINTPESTGKIEEYGKKASAFTKEVLSKATSILLESETDGWDPDSTGSRYLVWVWYKTAEGEPYRNLNIEILQNGLALANSTASSRYGETAMAALNQAKSTGQNIYSGQPDPDFFYGQAIELTLKELRLNIADYEGQKVAFSGVVSSNSGTQGVYVEDYDPETDRNFGIYIYYGHGLSGKGLDILSIGNRVRIVGSVQYYEGGGTYQVSDLSYRMMKPDDPDNIQLISEGNTPAYTLVVPEVFTGDVLQLDLETGPVELPWAQAALGTSISMEGLEVVDAYTTTGEESSSKGAMTLYCRKNGISVTVRTAVLLDGAGKVITQDAYLGKTIDVKGIVDSFDGEAQIKVFDAKNITIKN